MKNKNLARFLIISIISSVSLLAKVVSTRGSETTLTGGEIAEQVEKITSTYGQKNGDWVKPGQNIRFRTLNHKSCTVTVDRSASRLTNCKITTHQAFAPKNGSWSINHISVESLDGKAYSFHLKYRFQWTK